MSRPPRRVPERKRPDKRRRKRANGGDGVEFKTPLESSLAQATRAESDVSAQPSPEVLLRLYSEMVRLRTLDERMMTLQRQGRVGFYGACTGQEAATLASAIALEPSDWIFPALREAGAMLLRGFPLVPYLSQVFGNSGDETKGRQMPSHMASRRVNQVSWSSCIGTQLPQAVGAAWAAKIDFRPTGALTAGATANAFVVGLSGGSLDLFTRASSGTVHHIIDITGYIQ